MKFVCLSYILFLSLRPASCIAQNHDTLSNVRVKVQRKTIAVTSPLPVQILNTLDAFKTNSNSVADALRHFAGVSIKDFGGIGGLKTISVRSLGGNHTGILYDGIPLGNAQGGLIDLGKFTLDNIYQIELHTSGPSEILSPAKAFSYASLLLLKTSSGKDRGDSVSALNLKFQTGSFGYFSPSFTVQKQFDKRLRVSFNAQYQNAVSNYPFVSYGNIASRIHRLNSDVNSVRMEADAGFKANENSTIHFKSYYNNSQRGLPGAIIFYNTISNQRLNEKEVFVQGSWKNILSLKSELLISAKYQQDKSYYLDPSYLNNFGKLENEFHQKEIYLSGVYSHTFTTNLKLSFATDAFRNKLTRTDIFAQNFATPSRHSLLNNLAFQFKKRQYEFTGNLLSSIIKESVKVGESGNNFHRFSHGLAFSIQPFKNIPLRTRLFYKHIFRAPTFNDLYYTNVGNLKLRPEFADQYNIGITYEKQQLFFFKRCWFTTDAYYNDVRDKILAVPGQNLFQWSVQNIGKVKIKGVDVAIHTEFDKWKNIEVSSDVTYTLQEALDISDPTSTLYKTQLPYTPKHSGSGNVSVSYKNFGINYNVLFSSYRYKQGNQIYENLLQPFTTNDVSVSYFIKANKAVYKLIFEANNIFYNQYEIVKYYPMPLSNYRLTLNISLKQTKIN